ncbi:DUF3541 domain-containing protein [Candidatus Beckwithbacteria bacterium]|nr:DUF3541 domain-containing protein [Candidatus Beckwithbacteria bacterium]
MSSSDLVYQITATYLKNHYQLSPQKKRHFFYRAYVATKNPDVKTIFFGESKSYTLSWGKQVVTTYQTSLQATIDRIIKTFAEKEIKKINDQYKYNQYLKYPELKAYSSLLKSLLYLDIYGQKPDLSQIKAGPILERLVGNQDFIAWASVAAVNTVFLSKHLGLVDREVAFIASFQKAFSEPKPKDKLWLTNYIYGLTHMIIGDSFYYQLKINPTKFTWILNVFEQYQQEIMTILSLDIQTEVALCFKFLGKADHPLVSQIIARLDQTFDRERGYIRVKETSTLISAEHTNAVALILYNFEQIKLQ